MRENKGIDKREGIRREKRREQEIEIVCRR